MPFVPDDFEVPSEIDFGWCRLRPLKAEDNAADFAAWHSSVVHIGSTPGFAARPWPTAEYTLEQNETDLRGHEADFAARRGFTYTVLDIANEIIGCVYIYPPSDRDPAGADANVRSWVRADHAEQDADLYRGVIAWLTTAWPFTKASYASRL